MNARPWLAALVIAVSIVLVIGVIAGVAGLRWNQTPASLTLVIVVGFAALLGIVALVAIAYWLANLSNPNEALGLPAGSIRALIALLIIILFAVMSFYFVETLRTLNPTTAEGNDAQDRAKAIAAQRTADSTATTTGPTSTATTNNSAPTNTGSAVTTTAVGATAQTAATTTATSTAPAAGANTTPQRPAAATGGTTIPANVASSAAVPVTDIAKLVLQILGTLMTTIIGFYFGSKSAVESSTKTGAAIGEAVAKTLNRN